jgi:two-component system phosphate regulon sensor histidine kinase PhoR
VLQNDEIELSVDNIEHQLNRMHRIISGILDLERVRMGSNPIEICHPQHIIRDTLEELRAMAVESDVRLVTELDPNVGDFKGDNDQFKRAIINLVENAIKFNKPGGEVNIVVKNHASDVQFIIRDNGIGIPPELTTKIFDRFFRGHQVGAEHISGSGLGLSLVKAVIDSHNGQIRVESEPDSGTVFYITVPIVTRKLDVTP